jgi:hypothetical protein
MSSTDRQNRLLVAEDWKRIYQSFRNADFQSYDFENLRRVMINYLRENYPEDFNDYIESSEYLALIDMIAFLGQSIAFRVDLNARENFLELAERRESVLRLARLLNYNAKRNKAANGLLKFTSVSTTQTVIDSNGRNLSGQVVLWNDPANNNWNEQFIKVINAAVPASRQFGSPDDKATVYGIPTEQYRFQTYSTGVPVFGFTKTVDGRNMNFEVVSTILEEGQNIVEDPPQAGKALAFIYKDDGKGAASPNTGFFLHFRQGNLNTGTFTVTQPSTNEIIDIEANSINESDVWLYKLNTNGVESERWAKVPSFEGNNVIYNSLKKNIRNIFGVVTRANDRVSLTFSDGTFGSLPLGTFRTYYRVSNGLSYTINPKDVRNVSIDIPYISNVGQAEVLTLTMNLQSSVSNAALSESNDDIKSRAPATYYTQNRMITGEDYNISPLAVSQDVVKIKAVNRTSSGISRYFDLVDPTGKYSSTNLFGDDGIVYKEEFTDSFRFSYLSRTDIEGIIYNQILDVLKDTNLRNFYYANFSKIATDSLNISWYNKTSDTNQSTGYVGDSLDATPYRTGVFAATDLQYFEANALIKFEAPPGKYFLTTDDNRLVTGSANTPGAATSIWSKAVSISGDGTGNGTGVLPNGNGPISLNEIVPSGAILSQIIPRWRTTIDTNVISSMIELIFANKPFGLRYDIVSKSWKIIFEGNLNIVDRFSLGKQGNNNNQKLDSSWMLLFTTDTEFYTVASRKLRYVFESDKQIRFFFESANTIYDSRTNSVVKDKVKVLSVNNIPNATSAFTFDQDWEINKEFVGLDGYVDTKKVQLSFNDSDNDGIVDDPDIFENVVNTTTTPLQTRYVVLERYDVVAGQQDYRYRNNSDEKVLMVTNELAVGNLNSYSDGQYFYFANNDVVKKLDKIQGRFNTSLDYKVFPGRAELKFQYVHSADYETRIDPGQSNIIDLFILTREYDVEFRKWLSGNLESEPLPSSTDQLTLSLAPTLDTIKAVSDEIIYHPVKYKVLFGAKASLDVRASFKIIKNLEQPISDNEIKTRVLIAINEFFALENWDFGDSFYFSELAAYVMNRTAPYLVNFVIVPRQSNLAFGSLFEIKAESDQIFINGATTDDIEVVNGLTSSAISADGVITASSNITSQQSVTSRTGSY